MAKASYSNNSQRFDNFPSIGKTWNVFHLTKAFMNNRSGLLTTWPILLCMFFSLRALAIQPLDTRARCQALVEELLPTIIDIDKMCLLSIEPNLTIREAVSESGLVYPAFGVGFRKHWVAIPPGEWKLSVHYFESEKESYTSTTIPHVGQSLVWKTTTTYETAWSNEDPMMVSLSAKAGQVMKLNYSTYDDRSTIKCFITRMVSPVAHPKNSSFSAILPKWIDRDTLTISDSLRIAIWDSAWIYYAPTPWYPLKSAGMWCYVLGAISVPTGVLLHINGANSKVDNSPNDWVYKYDPDGYEEDRASARSEAIGSHIGGAIFDAIGLTAVTIGWAIRAKGRQQEKAFLMQKEAKMARTTRLIHDLRGRMNLQYK